MQSPPLRQAHLDHRGDKIDPRAIGFDAHCGGMNDCDLLADTRDLTCCAAEHFDVVYASPAWDRSTTPRVHIAEALRITRVGGSVALLARDADARAVLRELEPWIAERADLLIADDPHQLVLRRRSVRRLAELTQQHVTRADATPPHDAQPPFVSVLIVSEIRDDRDLDVPRLCATLDAAHRSLGATAHEFRVLLRERPSPDALARLRELALTLPVPCAIELDFAPRRLCERLERVARGARGTHLLVLGSGVVPLGDSLAEFARTASADRQPRILVPHESLDPDFAPLPREQTLGLCVFVDRALWPHGRRLLDSPYHGARLWNVWHEQAHFTACPNTQVVCAGPAARPLRAAALGIDTFDAELAHRGVPAFAAPAPSTAPTRLLILALRTFGDCVLATAIVDALRARHPQAHLTLATEARHAWIFRHHPGLDEVAVIDTLDDADAQGDSLFWHEQSILTALVTERAFDALVVLSDRLDNAPYFDAGDSFDRFYLRQAGLPLAPIPRYRVTLTAEHHRTARRILAAHGVTADRDYVVMHTRAGWRERTPPPALFERIAKTLQATRDLAIVVVGGAGECVDVPGVIQLAGAVPIEVSAAIIASAKLFVGPDSGSMHVASAFDVPTLALYGGTSLRLVPPRAQRAVAVQSDTSCARPCGRSPCKIGSCGADGFDDALLALLAEALLDGRDVPREWSGTAPAHVVDGVDGASLVRDPVRKALRAPSPAPSPSPSASTSSSTASARSPIERRVQQTAAERERLAAHHRTTLRALRHRQAVKAPHTRAAFSTITHCAWALDALELGRVASAIRHLLHAAHALPREIDIRAQRTGSAMLAELLAKFSWPAGAWRDAVHTALAAPSAVLQPRRQIPIGQHDRDHRLEHRDHARHDARVMSTAPCDVADR